MVGRISIVRPLRIMSIAKSLRYFLFLAVFISSPGCGGRFYQTQPFPDHKGAGRFAIYEPPPMLSITDIQCPDKLITEDFRNYIQSNQLIDSIIFIYFYDDKTGWRAIQITELKKPAEQRVCVEHLLEYDKSGARTKARKVSWHWHSF